MRNGRICWGAVLVGAGFVLTSGPDQAEAQAVGFQPNVATIPDGLSLSAVPAVSADRRYVRLSIDASFQTVNGFQNFGIPFAVAGQGTGTGGGAAAGALGGAGFPGAGGFRSVGVPMGMNGPVVGGGSTSTLGPRPTAMAYDSAAGDEGDAMDDGSWSPAPRRVKSARSKAARTKKATVTPTRPNPQQPSSTGVKP